MRRGSLLLVAGGMLAVLIGIAAMVIHGRSPQLVTLATATLLPSSRTSASNATSSSAPPTDATSIPASGRNAITQVAVPVATISIPRLGIRSAPIYDRATDSKGNMLIAPGYAVTHYGFSAPFGAGNAVIYGHDDIQGSIFGHLYDLAPGDVIQIAVAGQTQVYRVTGHQIVPPTAVAVMNPTADVRLTVITCWPYNVDTKRWIVTAVKI